MILQEEQWNHLPRRGAQCPRLVSALKRGNVVINRLWLLVSPEADLMILVGLFQVDLLYSILNKCLLKCWTDETRKWFDIAAFGSCGISGNPCLISHWHCFLFWDFKGHALTGWLQLCSGLWPFRSRKQVQGFHNIFGQLTPVINDP